MQWERFSKRDGGALLIDWKQMLKEMELDNRYRIFLDKYKEDKPAVGEHPHQIKQWLIASEIFPAKWINRIYSVGGIQWEKEQLSLSVFGLPSTDSLLSMQKAAAAVKGQPVDICYEDDFVLVLNKPIGMAIHAANEHQTDVLDARAANYSLACQAPFPVRHIHRLDADTSGAVIYSKNDLAQLKLDEAMRNQQIERHYLAIVHGRIIKDKGTIDMPIGRDRHISGKRTVTEKGDQAVTHYEIIRRGGNYCSAALQLETGRTHQIRVHMSAIGHPLVGDSLYGGTDQWLKHQALHAQKVVFPHPLTGERVVAESALPLWFEKLSASLIK